MSSRAGHLVRYLDLFGSEPAALRARDEKQNAYGAESQFRYPHAVKTLDSAGGDEALTEIAEGDRIRQAEWRVISSLLWAVVF